jgi:heat shock protein HslJ
MRTTKLRLAGLVLISQMILACTTPGSTDSADALHNSGWTLSSLPGQVSIVGHPATLNFANGRVSGSDGCNRYNGSYALTGDKLRIGGDLVATRMACPEPVMRQAEAFGSALTQATTFRRDGQRLLLLDAAGAQLATLSEQVQELAATAWAVTGYNNGLQAVVSVLRGSALTVVFAADGKVSGSAGCNHYSATYSTSGHNLRIGQPAATRKWCPQPDGVMEQEDRFLRALASAATWRLDGDRLELRTAAGALALSLRAKPNAAAPTPTPETTAAYTETSDNPAG